MHALFILIFSWTNIIYGKARQFRFLISHGFCKLMRPWGDCQFSMVMLRVQNLISTRLVPFAKLGVTHSFRQHPKKWVINFLRERLELKGKNGFILKSYNYLQFTLYCGFCVRNSTGWRLTLGGDGLVCSRLLWGGLVHPEIKVLRKRGIGNKSPGTWFFLGFTLGGGAYS